MINLIYLLIALLLLLLYIPQKRKQLRIRRWQKSLNLQEHAKMFQKLYQDVNGFALSKKERQKKDEIDYFYGEIEFLPFIALLSLIKLDHETLFYDLGCGTGKAVLACSMVYPVRKSVGVELFPELYLSACKRAQQLAAMKQEAQKGNNIEFILGDFLEVNLDDATVIFINSTALFGPTWERLCARLDHLPHLKTVITTSKALLSNKFFVVMSPKVEMSWGIVHAYIHNKKQFCTKRLENIE